MVSVLVLASLMLGGNAQAVNYVQPEITGAEVSNYANKTKNQYAEVRILGSQDKFKTINPDTVNKITNEDVKKSYNNVENIIKESSKVSLIKNKESNFELSTKNQKIVVPEKDSSKVEIISGDLKVNISLPKTDKVNNKGEILKQGIVSYTGESNFSNIVQVNNDNSIRMMTIIDNPLAPKEYEYKLDLSLGSKIELSQEGGALVKNKEGEIILKVSKPWAKDAEGKEVKTYYKVKGVSLIQVIEHSKELNIYPIIADPTWSEIQYCALPWNTYACSLASGSIATEARNVAEDVNRRFGWSLVNGGADAVRHCYWSGRMVQRIGASHAYEIGTRHESESSEPYKSMDLHNNAVGRVIGSWSGSTDFLKTRCINGVNSRWLKWY